LLDDAGVTCSDGGRSLLDDTGVTCSDGGRSLLDDAGVIWPDEDDAGSVSVVGTHLSILVLTDDAAIHLSLAVLVPTDDIDGILLVVPG
jgi:hypothetical protein